MQKCLVFVKKHGIAVSYSFALYEIKGKMFLDHLSILKIGPEVGLTQLETMKSIIEMTGEGVHRAWDPFSLGMNKQKSSS